jgi:hypothetical protein
MKHILLETAKRLHSLGFTRRTEFAYVDDDDDEGEDFELVPTQGYDWSDYPAYGSYKTIIFAPLAEEILELLPQVVRAESELGCIEKSMTGILLSLPWKENLADALALLLIELVEQGVVSKESLHPKTN